MSTKGATVWRVDSTPPTIAFVIFRRSDVPDQTNEVFASALIPQAATTGEVAAKLRDLANRIELAEEPRTGPDRGFPLDFLIDRLLHACDHGNDAAFLRAHFRRELVPYVAVEASGAPQCDAPPRGGPYCGLALGHAGDHLYDM